jgi:hypothetical protein
LVDVAETDSLFRQPRQDIGVVPARMPDLQHKRVFLEFLLPGQTSSRACHPPVAHHDDMPRPSALS